MNPSVESGMPTAMLNGLTYARNANAFAENFIQSLHNVRQMLIRLGQGCCSPDMREPTYSPAFLPILSETEDERVSVDPAVSSAFAPSVSVTPSVAPPPLRSITNEAADLLICSNTHLDFVALLQAGVWPDELRDDFQDVQQDHQALLAEKRRQALGGARSNIRALMQRILISLAEECSALARHAMGSKIVEKGYYLGQQDNLEALVPNLRQCRMSFARREAAFSKHLKQIKLLMQRVAQSDTDMFYTAQLTDLARLASRGEQLANSGWKSTDHALRKISDRLNVLEMQPFPLGEGARYSLYVLQYELHSCRRALVDVGALDYGEIALWRVKALSVQQSLMQLWQAGELEQTLTPETESLLREFFAESCQLYKVWAHATVQAMVGADLSRLDLNPDDEAASNVLNPSAVLQTLLHLVSGLSEHNESQLWLKQSFVQHCAILREGLLDTVYLKGGLCRHVIADYDLAHLQSYFSELPDLRILCSEALTPEFMLQHVQALGNLIGNSNKLIAALFRFSKLLAQTALSADCKADLGAWLIRLYENQKLLTNADPSGVTSFIKMVNDVMEAMQSSPTLANKMADQVMNASRDAACTDWAATALLDMQALIEADHLEQRLNQVKTDQAKTDQVKELDQHHHQMSDTLPYESEPQEAGGQGDGVKLAVDFVTTHREAFQRLLRFSAFKQFLAEAPSFQREHAENVEQALYLYARLKQYYDLPGAFTIEQMAYTQYAQRGFGEQTLSDSLQAAKSALSDELLVVRQQQLLGNLSAFGISLWENLLAQLPKAPERVQRLEVLNQALQDLVDAPDMLQRYAAIISEKEALLADGLAVPKSKAALLAAFGLNIREGDG